MSQLTTVIDTLHDGVIHDAAIDFYGGQMATCSADNVIKIFAIKNGTYNHVVDLKGHLGPVWQISWAHPKFGNIIASCSNDKRIIVWKGNREWTKVYECRRHLSSVNSLSFGPPEFGLILACGSSDGKISIHKLEHDRWEQSFIPGAHKVGVNAVSWGPYPMTLSLGKTNSKPLKRLASAGSDFLVKVWLEVDARYEVWEEIATLSNHCDWVRDVAWSPSVAMLGSKIASASQDKKVVIWSSLDDKDWTPYTLPIFEDVVWHVNWSLTGNILAVSEASRVTLWKELPNGTWITLNQKQEEFELTKKHKCTIDCYRKSYVISTP